MVIEIHSKTRTETLFPSLSLLYSAQPPPTFGNLLIDTYCGLCRTVLNRALGEQCVAPNLLLKNILHCLVTFSSYAYTPKSLKNFFVFTTPSTDKTFIPPSCILFLHGFSVHCRRATASEPYWPHWNRSRRTERSPHTHRLSFPSRSPLPIIQFLSLCSLLQKKKIASSL